MVLEGLTKNFSIVYSKYYNKVMQEVEEIIMLAEEFGLLCIIRGDILTIVGENQIFFLSGGKSMSTNRNLLTSPVGTIHFMAAENPVQDTAGKSVYTIKLEFDVEKDKDFLAQISEINDAKVVTAQTYRGKSKEVKTLLETGKALISASSQFKPQVYDLEGTEMEEAPYFFADSTGKAQMIVQPYQGKKGGTINLIGIIVKSIENPEGTTEGVSRETRLAQLRAAVEAATK